MLAMRPRWRKVLADLWENKARSLLVIVSIAVGVFSVGMIAGAYVIISHDMGASYASANPANIEMRTAPFSDELLAALEQVEGVEAAEGRCFTSVRVRTGPDSWTSLNLVSVADYRESQINLLVPLEGAAEPGRREVLLERNGLEKIGAAVGDVLEFELPDGTVRSMPVTGIVLDQSSNAGDFLASPLAYVSFDTLVWLHQPETYNRLYVTVSSDSNDEAYIRQVADAVNDRLERSRCQVYRTHVNKTNEHPLQSTVQAILGVLGALGVLIVLLSSSLIANTLSALLSQHQRHIGVMKLVGGRTFQIFGMYIVLILVYGMIALLIAIPLGGQAAYALAQLIADQMNFNLLGYRIVPLAFLIQTVIALGVPLASGFVPVNNGSRATVLQAVSGYNPGAVQSGWIDRLTSQAAERLTWISRPLLIALRNTFRRKGRLALTLFTLTMGGAIFVAVFNVRSALNNYLDSIGHYFLADVALNFDRPYRRNEIEDVALRIPGVEAIEGWTYASAEVLRPDDTVEVNLQILAPPAGSTLVSPNLLSGRWIEPGDEKVITVSEGMLEHYPDLQPGDTLRLKIAGQEDEWTVVGLFKFVGVQGLVGYASYETISDLLTQPNQAFTYRIVTDQHNYAYQDQMAATIDRHFRDLGYHVSLAEAGSDSLDTAAESLDILITFLLIMALLTATVGSMGLAGTMSMNVLDRTREIGVMRSIGAVDWVVMRTVIIEGLIIGLLSWFMGCIVAVPITSLLSAIIGQTVFATPLDFTYTVTGVAIWLGLVLVLSALASVLPARNAARLTIREVLAYE